MQAYYNVQNSVVSLVCSLQMSAIHWSINWISDMNFLSGNYLSKELISRLIKLDTILQKKIGKLDAEIQSNFMILMGITSLMALILVMAAHICYLSCKKRIDTLVTTKPNVSRLPVIREQHLPVIREPVIREPVIREQHQPAIAQIPKNNDIEQKTTPTTKNWIGCQYRS